MAARTSARRRAPKIVRNQLLLVKKFQDTVVSCSYHTGTLILHGFFLAGPCCLPFSECWCCMASRGTHLIQRPDTTCQGVHSLACFGNGL